MTNPEIFAQFKEQDFAYEDQRPIDGKSFENLRRFLAKGAIATVRTYPAGESADYSDKSI